MRTGCLHCKSAAYIGKEKGDSFMGSDLTLEDLSNRDLTHNNYKRLDDDMFEKVECFVLETHRKRG